MSFIKMGSRGVAVFIFALPWIAAAGVLGWVLVQRFPPSGVFIATTVMDGKSPFIHPFLPSERVSVPGLQPDGWVGQRITGDPTYATARVPGPYNRAHVVMEYRAIHQPLVEFGMIKSGTGDMDLSPMYSSELASPSWYAVRGGFAYQSTNPPRTACELASPSWYAVRGGFAYQSTSPGRLNSSDPTGLATWDATSTAPSLSDASGSMQETRVSLRGAHDFYFVPVGGSIDVSFGFQDANRIKGSSTVSVRVFRNDEELSRKTFSTNGSRDTAMGKVTDIPVRLSDAKPGVYRISITMTDDVFIRYVETTSRRWVVGPRLVFGDVVGYATTSSPGIAWTTSRHLVVETFHAEGLQTIMLGRDQVTLRKTHDLAQLNRTDVLAEPVRLEAPCGDIRLIGDGFFALRQDAFFEPKPKRMTDATQLSVEHIVGVLTPYVRPEDLGDGWLRSQFEFQLEPSQDTLRFVLSAPGIMTRAGAVDVRRITIEYQRDPLSPRAWMALLVQEAKNAWHRL